MKNNRRIKKEKNYWDKLSPEYDSFIQKNWKVYGTTLLDEISKDVDFDGYILDVACGTGLVSFEVAKKAKKVYGIDIAPSMINEANKKLKEFNVDNVEFKVSDAYTLPFNDNNFDIVICSNALHNMKEPRRALSEIKRVLKPEGKLITSVVGIGEKLIFKIMLFLSTIMGQLPVFHKLKLNEFVELINKAGFTVIKKERIKHPKDMMALLYIVGKKENKK